jgi:hypothetical protein
MQHHLGRYTKPQDFLMSINQIYTVIKILNSDANLLMTEALIRLKLLELY